MNVDATRLLAEQTSRGAMLIYISTDYVFPGTEGDAPYEADAETKPPNFYGQLKRDGELAVLEATKDTGLGIVLRVPVLYGTASNNSESAINTLIDAVWKAQDEKAGIKMDDWAQRYPTNTEDVARVCRDIVIKYVKEKEKLKELPKILQFSSEDRMTKYEICEKLAQVLGLSLAGMERNKQGNDPNASVQRPYDTHLSTKTLKDLGIDVSTMDFVAWWYVPFQLELLQKLIHGIGARAWEPTGNKTSHDSWNRSSGTVFKNKRGFTCTILHRLYESFTPVMTK